MYQEEEEDWVEEPEILRRRPTRVYESNRGECMGRRVEFRNSKHTDSGRFEQRETREGDDGGK